MSNSIFDHGERIRAKQNPVRGIDRSSFSEHIYDFKDQWLIVNYNDFSGGVYLCNFGNIRFNSDAFHNKTDQELHGEAFASRVEDILK